MPIPKKGQTKDEFISMCIPELIKEGKDNKQAVAQCHSIWEQNLKEATVTVDGFESPAFGKDLTKKGIDILGSAYASCRASWVKDHPKDKENKNNKRMCSQIAWSAVDKAGERKKAQESEDLQEGIRPLFGSPGGKTRLSKLIVSYFPDHKTYVEPFCGGAAVFFAKKPSDAEVLNDSDEEIAFCYEFAKDGKFSGINQYRLNANRTYFENLLKTKSQTDLTRFHKNLYLARFSFGNAKANYAPSIEATGATLVDKIKRLPGISERLNKVEIRNSDFKEIIKEFDSPDTFFYFDPPYPEQQGKLKTDLTNQDIFESMKNVKGKFILSLPDTKDARNIFNGFKIKEVQVRRTFEHTKPHIDSELLISNFELKENKTWLHESIKSLQDTGNWKSYDPSFEWDSEILAEDFRFLSACYQKQKTGEETRFKSIEGIIRTSMKTVQRILELGEITFHVEQMSSDSIELLRESLAPIIQEGPSIPSPHGELVWKGKQNTVVRLTENKKLETMGLLSSGQLVYGFIRFYPSEDIDPEGFINNKDDHKMTESEFPECTEKYLLYNIREFIPFDKPRQLEGPDDFFKGDERFFESTTLPKDWNMESLTKDELLKIHSKIHDEATRFSLDTSMPPNKELADRHRLITSEFEKRKMDHLILTELDKSSKEINLDGTMKLRDLTNLLKEGFSIRKPFLSFIGESCMSGWGDKIDIHINWPGSDEKFIDAIRFNLKSFLPPKLKESIQLVPDYKGAEVDFIPFAEIVLRIIPPEERKLMKMKESDISASALREARLNDIKRKRQAEQSRKEDKVELFRFFSQISNVPGISLPVASTIPDMIKNVNENWLKNGKFPQIQVNQKFPGIRAQIHKSNDKVVIFDINGKDVTKSFPFIVEEAQKQTGDFIVDANITSDAEKGNIANVLDTVLILEDIHNKPLSERRGLLEKLRSSKYFDIADRKLVKSESDLKIALKNFSNLPGSRGAVIKLWDSKYPLEGSSLKWMKLKK